MELSLIIGITFVTSEPSFLYSNEICMLWSVVLIIGCTILVPINLYTKKGQELILPVWYPYDEMVSASKPIDGHSNCRSLKLSIIRHPLNSL